MSFHVPQLRLIKDYKQGTISVNTRWELNHFKYIMGQNLPHPLRIQGHGSQLDKDEMDESLPQVEEFKYLRVFFTSDSKLGQDIDKRTGALSAVMM